MADASAVEEPGPPNAEALLAVEQILAVRGITRIMVVDDDYRSEEPVRLQDVVDLLSNGRLDLMPFASKFQSEVDLIDGDRLFSNEVVVASLEGVWEDLTVEAKADLLALVSAATDNPEDPTQEIVEDDAVAIVKLDLFLPDGIEFQRMSLAGWEAEQATLWPDGYPPTLVFFDRDFRKEKRAEDEGDKLVEALWRESRPNVYCGLLTHDRKSEAQIMEELATRLKSVGEVSVIAKRRLEDPADFALGLRVYLSIRDLHALKQHVVKSLVDTSADIGKVLDAADYYSLMAAFEAARVEGQFEPDGLSKLGSKALAHQVDLSVRSQDLEPHLTPLRSLAKVELRPFGFDRPREFQSMVRAEKFASADELNAVHAPIEAGDIFAIRPKAHVKAGPSNQERKFVLLVQPCDLSLRTGGNRSNDLEWVVLAEIFPRKTGADGRLKDLRPNEFELGPYGDAGEPYVVDVMKTRTVNTRVLDACVLDAAGESRLSAAMPVPINMAEGWVIRATKLGAWCAKVCDQYATYVANLSGVKIKEEGERMKKLIGQGLVEAGGTDGVSFHIDAAAQKVSFGVRREGRVISDVARYLLVSASQHRSRPDMENELFADLDKPVR